MIYTIYVCPECGAHTEASYHPNCPKKAGHPNCVAVEVVPRSVADELAAILAEPVCQSDERRQRRAAALAKYREAVS